MRTALEELKTRAALLQRALETHEAGARGRLRALAELRRADDEELVRRAVDLRRKHCLTVVARETGFTSWEHAVRVLDSDDDAAAVTDFGKLLYDASRGAFLHPWFATYAEAKEAQATAAAAEATRDDARYLLAYGRHFFLAGPMFIETLGLDPADPDFAAIGHDWARPASRAARSRLYAKLLVRRRSA